MANFWPHLYKQNFSFPMPQWLFPQKHPVLLHAKIQALQGSRGYPVVLVWRWMCACRENHMSSWAKRNTISSWCYQKKRNRCCIVFPSRAKAFFPIFDSLESILTSICDIQKVRKWATIYILSSKEGVVAFNYGTLSCRNSYLWLLLLDCGFSCVKVTAMVNCRFASDLGVSS